MLRQRLFFILTFLHASGLVIGEPDPRCTQLYEDWDNENVRLTELQTASQDLDQKFDSSVKADFNSQSEGVEESSHRTAAIKTAFQKKQLQKSLKAQANRVKKAKEKLCRECKEVTRPVPCEL